MGNDGKSPKISFESVSPGGVLRFAGVVANDDSFEEVKLGLGPKGCRSLICASSAASLSDIAEPFLCVVLNWNLAFGANWVRASSSFSFSALIA